MKNEPFGDDSYLRKQTVSLKATNKDQLAILLKSQPQIHLSRRVSTIRFRTLILKSCDAKSMQIYAVVFLADLIFFKVFSFPR